MPFEKSIIPAVTLAGFMIAMSLQVAQADIHTERAGMSSIGACFKGAEDQVPSCVEAVTASHDATLNAVYKDAVRAGQHHDATHPGTTDRLRDAQRAWIVFRDKGCLAEAGPPATPITDNLPHTFCMNRQILRRTDDLRDFIGAYAPQ